MTSALLLINKIKGRDHLRNAARHNLREIPVNGIAVSSPEELGAIERIAGPRHATETIEIAKNLLLDAGITRPRRDAVVAIEFVVSLSEQQWDGEPDFFVAATDWLAKRFGGTEHLLSAVIHRDESKPHLHVLQVPLFGGRLVGSDAIGGPDQFREHLAAFQSEVCAPHGLAPVPSKAGPVLRQRAWRAVLEKLRERKDPILHSELWPAAKLALCRDPIGPATLLGLDLAALEPKKRLRSSTSIFISKGKGPAVARS